MFFSVFGTKRKHTGLTNSEYAEELVRTKVLVEKLDLWWKLQFAAQDAKIKGSVFSLMFAFSRVLAPNTIILVQTVLNLQKNWSE